MDFVEEFFRFRYIAPFAMAVGLLLTLLLGSCFRYGLEPLPEKSPTDGDVNGDSDVDGDTDLDGDTDTDVDTDADGDADSEPDGDLDDEPDSTVRPPTSFTHFFGTSTYDWAGGVGVDEAGNSFITGFVDGSVNMGGGLLPASNPSLFLASYDPLGTHRWSKIYSAQWRFESRALTIDPEGNPLVTGLLMGQITIDGEVIVPGARQDAHLFEHDGEGEILRISSWGENQNVQGWDVRVNAEGHRALAGLFGGNLDFGGGDLGPASGDDAFVAVVDGDYNHLWSRAFSGEGSDYSHGVAFDGDGALCVVGRFTAGADFGSGPGENVGGDDAFVALFDDSGAPLGQLTLGTTGSDKLNEVAGLMGGGFFAVGTMAGSFDLDVTVEGFGGNDAVALRVDADGSLQWVRMLGGASDDRGLGVAVGGGGSRLFVAGRFSGVGTFAGLEVESAGSSDVFVVELDPESGDGLDLHRLGGAGGETVRAIAFDQGSGDLVVFGSYNGETSLGGQSSTALGSDDFFLHRFTP